MDESPYSGFCIIFLILALLCILWWATGNDKEAATFVLCVCLFLSGFTGIMAKLDN